MDKTDIAQLDKEVQGAAKNNKRQKREGKGQEEQESDEESIKETFEKDESGNMVRRVNMPKKAKHRMRAHINPMNEISIQVPKNPDYSQWHLHFPSFFGIENNNDDKIVVNTGKYTE